MAVCQLPEDPRRLRPISRLLDDAHRILLATLDYPERRRLLIDHTRGGMLICRGAIYAEDRYHESPAIGRKMLIATSSSVIELAVLLIESK